MRQVNPVLTWRILNAVQMDAGEKKIMTVFGWIMLVMEFERSVGSSGSSSELLSQGVACVGSPELGGIHGVWGSCGMDGLLMLVMKLIVSTGCDVTARAGVVMAPCFINWGAVETFSTNSFGTSKKQ